MTAAPRKQQTGIRKGDDGRYMAWCRICPNRAWRRLRPDERVGVWLDTAEAALEQGRRHRRAMAHLDAVTYAASNEPTHEEVVLARIFEVDTPGTCPDCGVHHSAKLSCIKAAQVRDREQL